jgi:hypothetical protein
MRIAQRARDFKGRRKPGGGYAYYNSCPGRASDIGRTFDIKGPNPTPDEQKNTKAQCSADIQAEQRAAEQEAAAARKRAEQEAEAARKAQLAVAYQAAQERAAAAAAASALQLRKSQTIPAVHVTVYGFECSSLLVLDNSCTNKPTFVYMRLEVTNQSKESLSGVLVGVAVAPANGNCPSSYAQTHTLRIPLSTGESRVTTITSDTDFLKHPVCVKVLDVQSAG